MRFRFLIFPVVLLALAWLAGRWLQSKPATTSPPEIQYQPEARNSSTSADDVDEDGFPDACELASEQDRRNFRRWFVSIAESQLHKPDPSWRKDDRDCAGFIRFAYREALKRHDSEWLRNRPFLVDVAIPDVEKYNYPAVPFVKSRIFRARRGRFSTLDLSDTTFMVSATASKLRSFNTDFVGKTLERVRPGDLLFYYNAGDANMPQHSMIYVGDWHASPSMEDFVVYHTGPRDHDAGGLKKVRLLDLLHHPDERWHPIAENPYFLGFFRWKILH